MHLRIYNLWGLKALSSQTVITPNREEVELKNAHKVILAQLWNSKVIKQNEPPTFEVLDSRSKIKTINLGLSLFKALSVACEQSKCSPTWIP